MGWTEPAPVFAPRVNTLVNDGDRLFRPRRVAFFWRTFAWLTPRHKFDDALPIFVAARRPQFLFQDWQHGTVELLGLPDTHPMNLKANEVQAGPRKNFINPTRPKIWKFRMSR